MNWLSDYGNCAFGASFDDFYLGGSPWQLPDRYLEKSPLFQVEKVTTPTIIFFGTEDTAVPTEQGWQWYRALHVTGKAPVRFLLFPGQPHGLGKRTHQLRKLNEELAWFDRHLFGKAPDGRLVVKEGSPLDVAHKRRGIARFGHLYGRTVGGILAPETVRVGDLDVGRFEVTRAQWAEFTAEGDDMLRANHPITGVTAEQARAYVAWLSQKTGEPWRLPTKAEHGKLPKGPSENTLDYWAGYQPSPTDAPALAEKVMALDRDVTIFAVGSRPAGTKKEGERVAMLFDVGGNVAELVVAEDGAVVPAGGCAVQSPDDREEATPPPAEYVGLRVVKGK